MALRKISFNLFVIVPEEEELEGRELLLEELGVLDWNWGAALTSQVVDGATLDLNDWHREHIHENPETYPVLYRLLQEEGNTPS